MRATKSSRELETCDNVYSGNIDVNITDHKLQYLIFNRKKHRNNSDSKFSLKRSYDPKNNEKFTRIIPDLTMQHNHMSRNKLTTSDERFNFFLNNLLDSFTKHTH